MTTTTLHPGTSVVEYTTATEMARVYQLAVDRLKMAHAVILQEKESLRDAFATGNYRYEFDLSLSYGTHSSQITDMERILETMKRQAWGAIIDKIGVRKVMSSKQNDQLTAYISGKDRNPYNYNSDTPVDMPDITPENIIGVIQGYYQSAPDLLLELVREEYDFWKPSRESEYKRNMFDRLAPRIIHGNMISLGYGGKPFHVTYNSYGSHITALDNIFHLLDGAGPVEGYKGPLHDAINTSDDGTGQTNYFRFRCYKNGNIHLDFRRLDLLAKFNELAGRNWIGCQV